MLEYASITNLITIVIASVALIYIDKATGKFLAVVYIALGFALFSLGTWTTNAFIPLKQLPLITLFSVLTLAQFVIRRSKELKG